MYFLNKTEYRNKKEYVIEFINGVSCIKSFYYCEKDVFFDNETEQEAEGGIKCLICYGGINKKNKKEFFECSTVASIQTDHFFHRKCIKAYEDRIEYSIEKCLICYQKIRKQEIGKYGLKLNTYEGTVLNLKKEFLKTRSIFIKKKEKKCLVFCIKEEGFERKASFYLNAIFLIDFFSYTIKEINISISEKEKWLSLKESFFFPFLEKCFLKDGAQILINIIETNSLKVLVMFGYCYYPLECIGLKKAALIEGVFENNSMRILFELDLSKLECLEIKQNQNMFIKKKLFFPSLKKLTISGYYRKKLLNLFSMSVLEFLTVKNRKEENVVFCLKEKKIEIYAKYDDLFQNFFSSFFLCFCSMTGCEKVKDLYLDIDKPFSILYQIDLSCLKTLQLYGENGNEDLQRFPFLEVLHIEYLLLCHIYNKKRDFLIGFFSYHFPSFKKLVVYIKEKEIFFLYDFIKQTKDKIKILELRKISFSSFCIFRDISLLLSLPIEKLKLEFILDLTEKQKTFLKNKGAIITKRIVLF